MSNTPTSKASNSNEIQLTNPKKTNIISTLAKDNGWSNDNPLYNYQGFWYHGYFLQGVISAQDPETSRFKPSPSDLLISSMPKSGFTWLKALSYAISTRTHFPIERFKDHPLHSTNPHVLVPFIEAYEESPMFDPCLHVFSTHIPYTSLPSLVLASGCKIVYIWRDPKDVFISYWHFARKVESNKDVADPIPLKEAFDLFCRGVLAFGPYWDHVLGYREAFKERPDKVLFLKYEDMINDAEFHVKRLAEFMGYPFSSVEEKEGVVVRIVEMCSFERMINMKARKFANATNSKGSFSFSHDAFFRKGIVGDWKNHLTKEMASKIDQITIDKLGTCGSNL